MGTSIVVDGSTFAAEVVQASHQKPVLIDFFATWCGPCQMLKPMLEKLVQEYDFILAKVDIDQNPDLATRYGVEGVPDVRVALQGRVYKGFVGVIPEHQLHDLMEKLSLTSSLDSTLEAIQLARATGDIERAKTLFSQLLKSHPDNRRLVLEAAKFLVGQGEPDAAAELVTVIGEDEKEFFAEAQSVKALIQFHHEVSHPAIASDLDALYIKGAQLVLEEQYGDALHLFLDLVGRDRQYRNDGARKAMLTIFGLLGDGHPLTKDYRKQLMLSLY